MIDRRRFLVGAVAAPATFHIVASCVLGKEGQTPPSGKLNLAGIGVGGQGGGLMREMGASENVGALCDVDHKYAARTFKLYPKAELFTDYRILLDKRKDIDAVVIATPDHMHAPITLAALRAGKHVYVEKPMAHSIHEARVMARVAKETGLVTQMGNNGHGGEGLRLTREWIQAGAIGKVREVHCWSDRPGKFWKQDLERPTDTPPVPPELDWNLWIGAAPMRPYHPVYAPRAWRGWFDFGTGAMGDMAIHNMDPAFYALDLGAPVAAEAQTSPLKKESFPSWQIITYHFAAKGDQPALKVIWYDGGKMPPRPQELEPERNLADNGIYFVGDKGVILCGGWAGAPRLVPESKMKDFQRPEKTIPRSIGHRAEWLRACKDRKPADAKAGFDYSGPYTEALLVGNLAVRLQKRIEWDSAAMKATSAPEAEPLIRKSYREGFGI
ncbi:MAG: 1,5-anhydro-D-fructose reductase [Planctomycetes bacterium ADurb.Bin126]|nr:MAG: 1,5-anhydro-D-fructose reductase [Planctomycetes bacterium ADurb.Bin126]HQL72979.1 Gfo/Idh/MocA family oxidoreductase [Phycisphaerae bacterium]